jgi:hypothetical protein
MPKPSEHQCSSYRIYNHKKYNKKSTVHNDGYEVLYVMLELVHPALQKDAVILPPKSHKCDDDIPISSKV